MKQTRSGSSIAQACRYIGTTVAGAVVWTKRCVLRSDLRSLLLTKVQIYFSDAANIKTRLLHGGPTGRRCEYNQTLRQLSYIIFHDPELKARFKNSPDFYNVHLNFDSETTRLPWVRWLTYRSTNHHPITNILTLAEFIVAVRGYPEPYPSFL